MSWRASTSNNEPIMTIILGDIAPLTRLTDAVYIYIIYLDNLPPPATRK